MAHPLRWVSAISAPSVLGGCRRPQRLHVTSVRRPQLHQTDTTCVTVAVRGTVLIVVAVLAVLRWSQAVAAAELYPRTIVDAADEQTTVYGFKLHELRHTAASLAIQAGANIKALQNMLGHESAGLTLEPLRPPVRVGRRGGRCRDQRSFNS
jgi:integrase-like protein